MKYSNLNWSWIGRGNAVERRSREVPLLGRITFLYVVNSTGEARHKALMNHSDLRWFLC